MNTNIRAQLKSISLTQQIDIIEKGMTAIIEGDKEIKRLYDLVVSVKGIGFVLASNLMVVTNCFMSISDSRKFACYTGLAPFKR
jgi:transposase